MSKIDHISNLLSTVDYTVLVYEMWFSNILVFAHAFFSLQKAVFSFPKTVHFQQGN